jgi:hypothetical protein
MACWWHGRLMVALGVSPAGSGPPRRRVMLRWPPLRRAVSGTQQRAPTRLGALYHPGSSVTYAAIDASPSARVTATRCWPSAT